MSRGSAAHHNVVLVTGSSTGFGRLIATGPARRRYSVFASMRDMSGRNRKHVVELEELRRAENLRLSVIELDVADDRSVRQIIDRMISEAGKIDVVVNNAELPIGNCWNCPACSRRSISLRRTS